MVLKQQLSELRSHFKEGMLVSQRHERPGATAILRWGPSFPRYTDGVTLCEIERKNLLQANLMLPAVGQIILVYPPFFTAEMEITKLHLMRIVAEADSSWSPYPVGLPSNEKLMQVLIGPAKRNLKRVVKLGNRAVAAHEKTTPDLGTDLPYPDPQLIHLRRLLCAAHARSLLK